MAWKGGKGRLGNEKDNKGWWDGKCYQGKRERYGMGLGKVTLALIIIIHLVEYEEAHLEKNCSLSPKKVFKALHVSSNWWTT